MKVHRIMMRRIPVTAVLLVGCCLGYCDATRINGSGYQDAGHLERNLQLPELFSQDKALIGEHGTTGRDHHKGSRWAPWWLVTFPAQLITRPTRQRRETTDVWSDTSSAGTRAIDDIVDNREASNPNSWTEYGRMAPSKERPTGRSARVKT
ncbi:uncharacterized protein LOC144868579 [Branchiostoma floridae x Branchiostoma japonicum]